MKKIGFLLTIQFCSQLLFAQVSQNLSPTPPMGWMSWNLYGLDINERIIKANADALVETGLSKVGFQYICIDDGWQGGRDKYNNLIPDLEKFPSGIKALADYVHSKGLKFGIYSSAGKTTCGHLTGSYGFEEQDAKVFAEWGCDYIKYDFCDLPSDTLLWRELGAKFSNGIKKTGRPMVYSIGAFDEISKPWTWAPAMSQSWRMGWDIRDVWETEKYTWDKNGILNTFDSNIVLNNYARPGGWNDPDMLVVGLYGKGWASSKWGNTGGCTDIEYQSNMSLWCLLAAPLMISCDLSTINAATKDILSNEEIISINQDPSGKQATLKIKDSIWNVLIKPLADGNYAIGILNRSKTNLPFQLNFKELGLLGKYNIRNVLQHKMDGNNKTVWKGKVQSHETIVLFVSAGKN